MVGVGGWVGACEWVGVWLVGSEGAPNTLIHNHLGSAPLPSSLFPHVPDRTS